MAPAGLRELASAPRVGDNVVIADPTAGTALTFNRPD
jgi:hypothetical protein